MSESLSERELRLEARVAALESLMSILWSLEFAQDVDPQSFADQAIRNAKIGTEHVTVPDLDPAQSDVFSQMLQEAAVAIFQRAKRTID